MVDQDVPTTSRGRRRDPEIDAKVHLAAVRVYARAGWSGFTFDAVAGVAGVGKPALYRRWGSREQLLVDALDRSNFPAARDCGSLRADLEDYAGQWVEWYRDRDRGVAGMRLWPDCQTQGELAVRYEQELIAPRRDAALAMTERAVHRGEAAADTSATLVAEIVIGATQLHWAFTPPEKADWLDRTFARHAAALVELILAGVGTTRA